MSQGKGILAYPRVYSLDGWEAAFCAELQVRPPDGFVGGQPKNLYIWLETPTAIEMAQNDPAMLAEIVHNNIAALDLFPDGNGRLSRLFAYFILIKQGLAPAYYTDMQRYFDVGNARSPVLRAVRQIYFRKIIERGQRAMRSNSPLSWLQPRNATHLAA